MKKHKGFTLYETVVAMLFVVPLLMLLVLYLHSIEQTVVVGQNAYQTQQRCQDFATQITAEIKMATNMTVSDSDKTLTLKINGKITTYTFGNTDGDLTLTKVTDSENITVFTPLDDGKFEAVGDKAVRIYVRLSPTNKIEMTLHWQDFSNSGEG